MVVSWPVTSASRRLPLLVCLVLVAAGMAWPAVLAAAPVELVVSPDGGAPFSTLSGAVAAAEPGAVIRLRPGIYRETVTIDKNLALIGAEGPIGSILDGDHRRPLLRITGKIVVQLENLEIRHGLAAAGPAARVSGGAVVDFLDCTFHDNTAREDAGAVAVTDDGSWVEFVACHFQRNRTDGDAGAVSVRRAAEISFRGCTFFANEAGGMAGAIAAESDRPLLIEQSLFIENRGQLGGAVHVIDGGAELVGNTFFRNASLDGASVLVAGRVAGDQVSVQRNIFCGDLEGAGLDTPVGASRACNLYFDNFLGPLLNNEPNVDELVANPEFCDFRGLDFSLRRSSPAADLTSDCGLIGAVDVGCLETLEASSWSAPNAPHRLVR